MNGWTKYFADGTKYTATDYSILTKTASWRNSRNTDIVAVELEYGPFKLRIDGVGQYWQSDTYESVYPGPASKLTKRRIEKYIEPTDRFYCCYRDNNCLKVCFNSSIEGGRHQAIPKKWIGQWIILEYDVATRKAIYYLRSKKV